MSAISAGYKHTEVGVIPEDWSVDSVESVTPRGEKNGVVDGPFGSNLKTIHYRKSGIPIITSGYVTDGKFFAETYLYVDNEKFDQEKRSAVKPGDIVMAKIGARCGASAILPETHEIGILSGNALKISVDESRHSTFYVWQVLWSLYSVGRIDGLRTVGAQPAISMANLKKYKLPLPPLPEQRAIATALSDVDALLAKLDQLIAKKRDLKQAAMQQLLIGETRLPGFSGNWMARRLGEVAVFFKGKGLPKSALVPFGAEPCIHYGELFTQYAETIREVISRTCDSANTFRSIANDVLMPTSDVTPRGLAKASCITDDGVILGGDILVIRSDRERICGTFLSYVIRSQEEQVLQLVTGSTVFHLYGSDMKKFTFSLPSLPEQTAIATVLSDMDAEIAALEARRDKIHDLKQGMMQELLTGRIRLVKLAVAD
jgi:type I restriction enzyme, S subunit